ncbi:MAG: molybdate transport system ATP-binding protein [Halieaceae bacterium]|jgi:molybdate transport system ATP-binding protein
MIKVNIHIQLNGGKVEKEFTYQFQIENGSFVTIYGSSGGGKTTLLRSLAGFVRPKSGTIEVGHETLFNSSTGVNVSAQNRGLGMVFQDHKLFPNMTVLENLKFASPTKSNNKIKELIDYFDLTELLKQYPANISGGQEQRVAIAQALVKSPSVLLLDEPMTALDFETRLLVQEALLKVQKNQGLTVLMVSHDLRETLRLSDQVILVDKGSVIKMGAPQDVFENVYTIKQEIDGVVVGLEIINEEWSVNVLLGEKIINVTRALNEFADLKIGDVIRMEIH